MTVNVFVPVPETLVFTLTPGPVRWKSWIADLSSTTSLILPAFVGFVAILIVKPGPTVPLKVGVAAAAGSASAEAAATEVEGDGERSFHLSPRIVVVVAENTSSRSPRIADGRVAAR